jgi:small conductance mechanosensitive channel
LTPDNVHTFVGNNKLLSDNIQNFSSNAYRRVELTSQIADETDPRAAITAIAQRVGQIPNVLQTPAPDVSILSFTPAGPVLAVRPYCSNDHYWQVYFDTNMAIREVLGSAPFPAPMLVYGVKQMSTAAAAGK